jgi:1-acyl-sn-glycerol-3-phosphate acyltransferase
MRRFLSSDGPLGEMVFRAVRGSVRIFIFRWLRLRAVGAERIRVDGPFILAPVHRSNLDGPIIGSLTHRRVRYLGKESLFRPAAAGWIMRSLGSFPVRRGEADLDAMRAARQMLEAGEVLLVFPEGTRQQGDVIGEIFDGTAWLAAKSGCPVVPVGCAGTEAAMPTGVKFPRRIPSAVVIGDAIEPPVGPDGGRARRSDMREWTEAFRAVLQECQDRAVELAREAHR